MGDGSGVHLSAVGPGHKSFSAQDPPASVVAPLLVASSACPPDGPSLLGVSSANTSMAYSPPSRAPIMFLSRDMACSRLPLNLAMLGGGIGIRSGETILWLMVMMGRLQ
jgi:hypothetical protein